MIEHRMIEHSKRFVSMDSDVSFAILTTETTANALTEYYKGDKAFTKRQLQKYREIWG
jgi:hypothetical protein